MDYQPQDNRNVDRYAGLASASVILGIIGCILSPIPILGLGLPALALTLALLTRDRNRKTKGSGKTGMVLGIIGLILSITISVATIVFVVRSIGGPDKFFEEYQKQLEYQLDQPTEL